jgi:hypothetical protein
MEYEEMTTQQLREETQSLLEKATTADLKWVYCYYKGFDKFPLLTDATAAVPDELHKALVPGPGARAGGEEVPF